MTTTDVSVVHLSGGMTLTNANWKHVQSYLLANIKYLRSHRAVVATRDTKRGKVVAICGSGPSLADSVSVLGAVDEVWGCNNAAVWLYANGHRATAGVGIGMEPTMLDEWEGCRKGMPFYLASHTHPSVTAALVERGHPLRFFHSLLLDLKIETPLWRHYPPTITVGIGLNVVTRAIALAHHMGFAKILVLGADCAMRRDRYYADGRTFQEVYQGDDRLLRAEIDGREWITRPDMAITATELVHMLRMPETAGGRLELVGDTLPNTLKDKPQSFLDQMPHVEQSRITGFQVFRPYQLTADPR